MADIDINTITDENVEIPANSEPAPTDEASGIPESVLEIPLMRGILEGAPAAIYTPVGTKGPEIETVLKHGKDLNAAGIGFFRDEKNKLDVIYNSGYITKDLLEAAAKKSKIPEVAELLSEVSARVNSAVGAPAAGAPAPMGGSMEMNLAASPVNTARINNLQPGSPTSGPQPGAGRILNNLTKPVI